MQVLLPYKIGHTFWLPRVYRGTKTITKVIDGLEYSRKHEYLTPDTRHKIIEEIVIKTIVNKKGSKTEYEFYCDNYPKNGEVLSHNFPGMKFTTFNKKYTSADLKESFKTEAEAMEFAKNWIRYKKTTYFSATEHDDDPEKEFLENKN
jgi:hypothetical protein